MSDLAAQLTRWIDSLPADIETVKSVLETATVKQRPRQYAGGALNYVVARMDLVPDWIEEIGLLDDAMVLRICMDMGNGQGLIVGIEDPELLMGVGKLLNEIETIEAILGRDLYDPLREYCERLTLKEVHGRTATHLVDDADMRASLYRDLDNKLSKLPTPNFRDVNGALERFRSYLRAKLW